MLFPLYLDYVRNTEVPKLFHVWCATAGISATLGKRFYFPRGHFNVFPNLYVMLIGTPGTGKGTSMSILQNLLLASGYSTFAADKSSKEKFLLDLQAGFQFSEVESSEAFALADFLEADAVDPDKKAEVFILAEEFNDFIGTNNIEFISLLTKLWSYTGVYRNRLKNSKSVNINEPCVNMLGGNTSAGFNMAFPPEIIGQGFLARLIPVYGEATGKRISFPERPDPAKAEILATSFRRIREEVSGEARIESDALLLLDRINQEWVPLSDMRFQHYSSRRFNQLLKLCLVQAAGRISTTITVDDIRAANTILSNTEELMPLAIGEFGKSKNSDVASKIMEVLYAASAPISTQDLWKTVSSDLVNFNDLITILQGLSQAEKIQAVNKNGWLPKRVLRETKLELINSDLKRKLT